jgi:hypothetical protein
MAIRIAQARKRLVQRVPGGPEAIEIEAGGSDVAFRDLVERLASPRQRAQIAVAVLVLDDLQLADDVVGAFLETPIAGGGPHQADGRKIVSGDVPGQVSIVAVPAAVPLGLRLEARARPVEGEHPIRLERQQIGGIEILRLFQRPAGQPDGRQWQRPRDVRHGIYDAAPGLPRRYGD